MNENTQNKNEIRNLRIFAVLVFAVLLSATIIVGKCNKDTNNNNFTRLHFLTK